MDVLARGVLDAGVEGGAEVCGLPPASVAGDPDGDHAVLPRVEHGGDETGGGDRYLMLGRAAAEDKRELQHAG